MANIRSVISRILVLTRLQLACPILLFVHCGTFFSWEVLARTIQCSALHFDRNRVVISEPDVSEVEEFVKAYSASGGFFDGRIAIPGNLQFGFPSHPGSTSILNFTTGRISAQGRAMRRFMRDIKSRSGYLTPEREVEFGAAIFEFYDGSTIAVKMTSKKKSSISFWDESLDPSKGEYAVFVKAIGNAFHRREKYGVPIRRILFVHTHPNLQYHFSRTGEAGIIAPTEDDFLVLQLIQNSFTFNGKKPIVDGIVLPNCVSCGDLFLHFTPEGLTQSDH